VFWGELFVRAWRLGVRAPPPVLNIAQPGSSLK
jgi:hypothetical protein